MENFLGGAHRKEEGDGDGTEVPGEEGTKEGTGWGGEGRREKGFVCESPSLVSIRDFDGGRLRDSQA